jgi:hypothetical protein
MKHRSLPVIVILIFLVLCMGLPTFYYPLGRDQGNLAYSGSIILKGQVPHRDSWDQKPPGVAYLYALAFLLFGKSMEAVRALDILYHLIAVLLLFELVKTLYSPSVAFWAGVWYSLSYFVQNNYFSIAHVDGFLNLPLITAAYLCYRGWRHGKKSFLLLAGFFCSLAFIIKYPSLLVFLGFILYLLGSKPPEVIPSSNYPNKFQRWVDSGFLVLGFILGLLLITIYLLQKGALYNLLETQLVFNAGYTRLALQAGFKAFLSTILVQLSRYIYYKAFFSVLAAAGLVYCFKYETSENRLVRIWFFASLLGVVVQAKFYYYQWMGLLAPFSILSAIGLRQIFEGFCLRGFYFKNEQRIFALTALFILILPTLNSYQQMSRTFIDLFRGTLSLEEYYARLDVLQGDTSLRTTLAVVDYLQQRTNPEDTIYIWGSEPLIYFLADRASPTLYTFNVPLVVSWGKASWREKLLQDLARSRPRYILVAERDGMLWTTGRSEDSKTLLEEFSELKTFLMKNYHEEGKIGHLTLYRVNSS